MSLLAAGAAHAQTSCDRAGCGRASGCFTPAQPPPASLWGDLQPTDQTLCSALPVPRTPTDPQDAFCLPAERDASDFNEFTQAYASRNWYYDVDVENGFVFAGLAHGIAVFDGRANAAQPTLLKVRRYGGCSPSDPGCAGNGTAFPWIPGGEYGKIVFGGISAPPGVDTIAAIAGHNGAGLLVFAIGSTDHSVVTPKYQSVNKDADSVYAATIGGVHYAFMASKPSGTTLGNAQSVAGVVIYNLDRAVAQAGCLEDVPGFPLGTGFDCPAGAGVYVGTITWGSPLPNTPVVVHGVGNYIVVSFGGTGAFQIYDVSVPTSPQLKLQGSPGGAVQGVAMWQQGSSYYLSARVGTLNNIYDVSCIASSCAGLGAPLSSGTYDGGGQANYLSFSRASGGRPFLYLGTDASCQGTDGKQHEWLLDVSDPRNPADMTPPQTIPVSAPYSGVMTTVNVNYWSWGYRGSPTGFYLVAPHHGKFNGSYFYRAARSIMDFHLLTIATPPFVDFSWSPTSIYPGDTVSFSDQSSGMPNSWSWGFSPDGSPSTSTLQNPQVSFAAAGAKSVTLTASNSVGTGAPVTKSLTVLNPAAQVASLTFTPANPVQCQQVNLTANNVAGKPPLTYAWTDSNNAAVSGLAPNGTTATWTIPGSFPPNTSQTIQFTVSNGLPSSATASANIPVGALPTLAQPPAPTTDAYTAATVQFHLAAVAGATTWSWNFGDGSPVYTTSDATLGPNPPAHTFPAVNTSPGYLVTVTVSNCVNVSGLTSPRLTVPITQTTPLVASFQPVCAFAPCSFTVGSPITFVDSSTGATYWDYDWNHNTSTASTCNYTDSGHTSPVTSHTYTATGNYQPCLRVRRGASEQSVYVLSSFSVSSAGPPPTPTITVFGPSSGQVGAALSFSATASNCTPSSTWTWNVGSGAISGSATGSGISASWSSAGTMSVSVTNSGCSGATGFKSVSIGGSTGGGTLGASFTYSPSSPAAGSAVSFDGTASTGATGYFWTFGDGQTSAAGATVTHTYAQTGTYQAKLDVSATMSAGACSSAGGVYLLGTCTKTSTPQSITVVSGGPPPPPPLGADFTSSICTIQFGLSVCAAQTGVDATFTSTANSQVTSWSWDFGDGGSASGQTATHHWNQPGSYSVQLTVSDGSRTASKAVNVTVTGAPKYAYILPWIGQTAATPIASGDLYAYNPGASAMTLTVSFLRTGGDASTLPTVQIPIPAGQTFHSSNALALFTPPPAAGTGFLYFTWDGGGGPDPVISSTGGPAAAGSTQPSPAATIAATKVPQISPRASASTSVPLLNLVGLAETADKLSILGVSNPYSVPATINVRFYDQDGNALGTPILGMAVARNGLRQYTVGKIRDVQHVSGADFRATVEAVSGGPVTAFAAVTNTASRDVSVVAPGSTGDAKQYLIGVTADAAGQFTTDVLLVNPGTNVILTDMSFLNVIGSAPAADTIHLTLQPGQTLRISDVLQTEWGLNQALGTLVFESDAVDGVYPIVRGELHKAAPPASQVGMILPPLTDTDAAAATDAVPQSLLGLRLESGLDTTLWIFNPTGDYAQFDLVFRDAGGNLLGTKAGVILGPGKLRQLRAAGLPVPASVPGGFTLQVHVTAGSVLATGQVRTVATGDTRYLAPNVP